MAAVRDPRTGTAPPPVIRGEAPGVVRRDAGRATAQLYRRHAATVYRFAWQMLGAREDAEDATQATFLSVYAALADGTVIREPQAWVLRIARNECLARIEARMRRPLTASLDDITVGEASLAPSVPRTAELRSDLRTANDALGRLPAAQREAYVMREWLGLSTAEVAVALGTTVIAVEGLLARARRELVRVLGASDEAGAAGCRHTCEALAAGTVDRAARAHLVRCRACRSVRRALRPQQVSARSLAPPAALAERLGDTMPGFATIGAGGAMAGTAAGGGGLAAVVAKVASGPAAMKGAAAALTAMAAVGGGVAIEHGAVTGARPAHVVTVATQPVKAKAPAAPKQAVPGGPTKVGQVLRGPGGPVSTAAARTGRARAASGTASGARRAKRAAPVTATPTTARPHRSGGGTTGSEHHRGRAPTESGHQRHRGDTSGSHRGGDGGGKGRATTERTGDGRDGGGSGRRRDAVGTGQDVQGGDDGHGGHGDSGDAGHGAGDD